jgi:phenylalanyl-tRNA synthetase beta chain
MKVSLNKIRYAGEHYKTPDLVPDGLEALVEKIGAQLGAVEEVIDYGGKFDGVIIVKVVSCEKHPNADKLNVCRVDDGKAVKDVERGDDGLVQVVCGAPNVTAGMLAAWLPPGAVVPSTRGKDEFVLEARELRGEKSNGMLASPKELGIGDSHEGLLVIDKDVEPGTSFAKAYRVEDEAIIDIENKMFTHRPDCFGIMGVTREVAGIQQQLFKSPAWYAPKPETPQPQGEQLPLTVTNELPELVPRFTAVAMSGVVIKPSPIWLQLVLGEAGIRPINNVVDYTNFWMLETGQPLHAYDYDKVKALSSGDPTLVVRNPRPAEKIKLLNGKEIEPRAEAVMIATDKQLIGVGGVMGGSETEVDQSTKNIILECANFDMYSIRRTSMAHGLFTDAVTRFTKGQSPLQNLAVLLKTAESVQQDAGGSIAGDVADDNHVDPVVLDRASLFEPVKVAATFVNTRLGSELPAGEMKQLLENVEFQVELNDDELTVAAPFWRTDIELREDVVEEIGRLYGYDRLSPALPKRDLTPAPQDPLIGLKNTIRQELSKAGANELLTYSFVHGDLLDKVGQDRSQAFQISNALSPDLQYYRLSLAPSLLDKVHPNIKAGYDQFTLFELGKAHVVDKHDEDGLPHEFDRLAVVFASKQKIAGAPYYQALEYLMNLLGAFGMAGDISAEPLAPDEPDPAAAYYTEGRSATIMVNGQVLGRIGEFKPTVQRALKLPACAAGFEIGLRLLLENQRPKTYESISRFPKVTQDMTLRLPADVPYQALDGLVAEQIAALRPERSYTSLLPIDIFQREDDAEHKQITFRLEIASYERTLTDPEVNKLLDEVAAAAKAKFDAERI